MHSWLLIAAALHGTPANAGTQLKGLAPAAVGHMSGHPIDLRLSTGTAAQLMFREIDLQRQIAPGAEVGVGMAGSSDAMKNAFGTREKPARRSHGPAVSFVLKF